MILFINGHEMNDAVGEVLIILTAKSRNGQYRQNSISALLGSLSHFNSSSAILKHSSSIAYRS